MCLRHVLTSLLLFFSLGCAAPVLAAPASDGFTLLRMCRGAGKVSALGVMCHSYLNGFLAAVDQYGKRHFCLGEHEKEHLPEDLVKWLDAHPDSHKQAAGKVLDRFLAEAFPCQRR
jgi:hypothetical protein